jgi:hypothetical protein
MDPLRRPSLVLDGVQASEYTIHSVLTWLSTPDFGGFMMLVVIIIAIVTLVTQD